MLQNIEKIFSEMGGTFVKPVGQIAKVLNTRIKAFLFDWDGVFNDGFKGPDNPSMYSEANAMGTNMLRFGYWLTHEEKLPFTGVITGANNHAAIHLAEREHFETIYFRLTNKALALKQLEEDFGILPHEVAFCFDDILDLPIAEACGLRFMVRRKASPMLERYTVQQNLCDYITYSDGGEHAVREISELILALMNVHDKTVQERTLHTELYTRYLRQRRALETRKMVYDGKKIVPFAETIRS